MMIRIVTALALLVAFTALSPVALVLAHAAKPSDCVNVQHSEETTSPTEHAILDAHLHQGDTITLRSTVVSGSPGGMNMDLYINDQFIDSDDIPTVFTWTAPADGIYNIEWGTEGRADVLYRLELSCQPSSDDVDSDGDSGPVIGPPCPNVFDSRINNSLAYDCAAPVAVYAGSLDVYGIHPQTGEGLLLLHIEDDMLTGNAPTTNTLLGETVNPMTGQPIHVYRLTSNEIYLATAYADGKPYIVVWQNGSPDTLYHVAA